MHPCAILISQFFNDHSSFSAILSLYLSLKLDFDESSAVYIFHTFSCLVYFFPLLGSILADGWLGKYRTILYLSLVYALGTVFLSASAIPLFNIPTKLFTWIGLLLIAIGTGGIKPCVSAFGGDQFKLPEQIKAFAVFFQLFYAAINAGSLISTLITPILRENVECFGEEDCYSLAFGVPTILMIVSIVIFVSGQRLYVINEPTGRLNQTLKCMGHGIYKKIKEGRSDPKDHWLDYAQPKYGTQMVKEIKVLLRILVLFIPMPMFWALYDQQGSRWTFQATRTDPQVGEMHIKPDQLQFLNPLLIIIFIPLFKYIIYPLMKHCDIRRPLQKMGIGGVLIMCSFIVSGMIENAQFEAKLGPVLPGPEESSVILFNGYPCDFGYQINDELGVAVRKYSQYAITLDEDEILHFEWNPLRPAENCETVRFSIKDTRAGEINTYLVRPPWENAEDENARDAIVERFEMDFHRPKTLMPDVTIILANRSMVHNMTFYKDGQVVDVDFTSSRISPNLELPKAGHFKVDVNYETILTEIDFAFAQNSLLILGVDKRNESVSERIFVKELKC